MVSCKISETSIQFFFSFWKLHQNVENFVLSRHFWGLSDCKELKIFVLNCSFTSCEAQYYWAYTECSKNN